MSCGKPKYAQAPNDCPYDPVIPDCAKMDCTWFVIKEQDIVNQLRPFVSILMPYYNRSNTINKALASIAAQTYTNFEVCIVDDASDKAHSEALAQAVQRHPKLFIKVKTLDVNQGQAIARNEAFKMSSGSIIAYLDSDDEYKADHLMQRLLEMHTDPDVRFVFGNFDHKFYETGTPPFGKIMVKPYTEYEKMPDKTKFPTWQKVNNMVSTNSVIHDRGLFIKAGGFEPNVVCGEDGLLWRRMFQTGAKWAYSDISTSYYCFYGEGHEHQSKVLKMPDTGNGIHLQRGQNGQELDINETYKARYKELKQFLKEPEGIDYMDEN